MVTRIFVNPAGQRDNLGDSVLRRPYLDWLRQTGRLYVLARSDDDFGSALELHSDDHAYSSRALWLSRALVALLFEGAVFAVNAGEVVGTVEEMRNSRWQSLLAFAATIGRPRLVACGLSIRPGTNPAVTHVARFSRVASPLSWRDRWSRDAIGRGTVTADWAFATGTPREEMAPSEDRTRIAVVMRGDRPAPKPIWIDSVRSLCEAEGLDPIVVVQVRRDLLRATEIGELLDAEVVAWSPSANHAEQESVVRSVYRQCRAVISDRIHALILGLTEGAVPLGTTTVPSEKISRTFEPVTDLPVGPQPWVSDLERWQSLVAAREDLLRDLENARSALGALKLRARTRVC